MLPRVVCTCVFVIFSLMERDDGIDSVSELMSGFWFCQTAVDVYKLKTSDFAARGKDVLLSKRLVKNHLEILNQH